MAPRARWSVPKMQSSLSFSTFERHTPNTVLYKLWVLMELRACRKRPHGKCRKWIFEGGAATGQLVETRQENHSRNRGSNYYLLCLPLLRRLPRIARLGTKKTLATRGCQGGLREFRALRLLCCCPIVIPWDC